MIPKHPNKKQFASIQKWRFEAALETVLFSERLKNTIEPKSDEDFWIEYFKHNPTII